ncbi:RraA family protein [Cupriavidus basilensis]
MRLLPARDDVVIPDTDHANEHRPHPAEPAGTREFPHALGHFLEDGFARPRHSRARPQRQGGRSRRHAAAGHAQRHCGEPRAGLASPPAMCWSSMPAATTPTAPVGAVTGTAALCAGAKGIIVDGVVTDILELRAMGIPVFASGSTSVLTTKRIDEGGSAVNEPVICGGVTVNPGDIVLADDNGVLFLSADAAAGVIARALASDGGRAGHPRPPASGRAGCPRCCSSRRLKPAGSIALPHCPHYQRYAMNTQPRHASRRPPALRRSWMFAPGLDTVRQQAALEERPGCHRRRPGGVHQPRRPPRRARTDCHADG